MSGIDALATSRPMPVRRAVSVSGAVIDSPTKLRSPFVASPPDMRAGGVGALSQKAGNHFVDVL